MIQHPLLSEACTVVHGFFTRRGGASTGLYATRNCGFGAADDPQTVEANRAAAVADLGLPSDALLTLYQVHSPDVVTVQSVWPRDQAPRADAMVTDRSGIALGVLAADCAPVLLADPIAGVIGAAHAGWKGALTGVVEATVAAMVGLGAERARLRAVVGPCIGPSSYEVGPEFRDRFLAAAPGNGDFFAAGQGDRLLFDLPGYVLARAADAGVARAHWVGHDTFAEPEAFFSYRRSCHAGEPDYGRLLSAIALAP